MLRLIRHKLRSFFISHAVYMESDAGNNKNIFKKIQFDRFSVFSSECVHKTPDYHPGYNITTPHISKNCIKYPYAIRVKNAAFETSLV